MSVYSFCKGDGSVVEGNVELSAIERSLPNLIDMGPVQSHRSKLQVKSLSWALGISTCRCCDSRRLGAPENGTGGEENREGKDFDCTHGLAGLH